MANLQIVPVAKKVEVQYVEMKVPLYSYGCEKKVKKALANLKGIHSVHVDYELQKVTVWGICNRDVVLATIKKKRREARFWHHHDVSETGKKTVITAAAATAETEEETEQTSQVLEKTTTLPSGLIKSRRSWKRLFPLMLY